MSHKLNGRLTKLEQQVTPQQRRLWLICRQPGETTEAALVRHGIEAGEQDCVIVIRYGCPDCRERETG